MQSSQAATPVAAPSCWKRFFNVQLPNALNVVAALGACLPNIQYAAAFPRFDPQAVSYDWLKSLAGGTLSYAIYNSVGTLTISGAFGFYYFKLAAQKIKAETLEVIRERKNKKRFLALSTMTILCGITGSSIFSNPYSGNLKTGAYGLGFIIAGAFSFLGTSDLISSLGNKHSAFQAELSGRLARIHSDYFPQCSLLLKDTSLNETSLSQFLVTLFNLAAELEAKNINLFREETTGEKVKKYGGQAVDAFVSLILTALVTPIYIQSGFSGSNLIFNNNLSNLPKAAKIAIGALSGTPSSFFAFFTMKDSREFLLHWVLELKHPVEVLKAAIFIMLLSGNATWYYSLARTVAKAEDNIFSLNPDNNFGETFACAAYITAVFMGLNGVGSKLFPRKIQLENPSIQDTISYLKTEPLSSSLFEGLKKHHFFNRSASGQLQLPVIIPPLVKENFSMIEIDERKEEEETSSKSPGI